MPALHHAVGRAAANQAADVRMVQMLLNHALAGSTKLVVDGQFGPRTLAAIEQFQSSIGLKPDGLVQPKGSTMAKLFEGQISAIAAGINPALVDMVRAAPGKASVQLAPVVEQALAALRRVA